MRRRIRLTESDLKRVVYESTKRVLMEMGDIDSQTDDIGVDKIDDPDDEFEYSDSYDLGRGRHRQEIIYNGKEVGYLLTIEKNWLAPLEEIYVIPDVEAGMDTESGGWFEGKRGWIKDWKRFHDYDEAFNYVKSNFGEVAYMFEFGDYD